MLSDKYLFICKHGAELSKQDMISIIGMIICDNHEDLIHDNMDGSRIDLTKLPADTIKRIYDFVKFKSQA
jgi:hypothetical protein